jgi:glycosyltransferase involved in cell wall biosynthesis
VTRLACVVPCFNEERLLRRLCERLAALLPETADDYEVVLVDDGSTDGTLTVMRELAAADQRYRYVSLSRNFGKEAAMVAGLRHADADAVVIMDADLQHPPELVAHMVKLLDDGYEQVVARRSRTGDPALRSLAARTFYRMVNKLVDVRLEDGIGDFRVLSRKAVDAVLSLHETNRFSKGLFAWIGYDTAVVDYENVSRGDGRSKWTLRKLVDYGVDGVVSFNTKPLRAAIHLGVLCTVLAFAYAAWVLMDAVVNGNDVRGYVTIMCGIVFFGGVQLVLLGVVGEYLGRIYLEAKRRPHFLVKESNTPDRGDRR